MILDLLLVTLNFLTVILGVLVSYYSYKLIGCLNSGFKTGWWTLLPIIFTYLTITRVFILFISLGYFEGEGTELLVAIQFPFWIGAFIFIFGLYKTAKKMLVCA